ncbi:hypothetical protein AMTR_s00018p00249540 [Amborella trichopoda]|uniref:Uncharacterized protein n=1 Tax=Amborella trichopoda TaxID=13333 RepID=W1PJS2_AMBTC|nr:hypothetical protein AMTR_s00018p00249540 [Amborella trichopoda]
MPWGECPFRIGRDERAASGVADEDPIIVQEKELGISEESEPPKAVVGDEGSELLEKRSSFPLRNLKWLLRMWGMGDEVSCIAQGEVADSSEQLDLIALIIVDEGVGDEGPRIALGEETGPDERLEKPEVDAPNEVIETLIPELSEVEARSGLKESENLGFEVASLEAAIAMTIVPSTSASAAEATSSW